ncbi:MAG: hypothetical protein ABJE66_04510 [Deltaproteobacteria bacterium]
MFGGSTLRVGVAKVVVPHLHELVFGMLAAVVPEDLECELALADVE